MQPQSHPALFTPEPIPVDVAAPALEGTWRTSRAGLSASLRRSGSPGQEARLGHRFRRYQGHHACLPETACSYWSSLVSQSRSPNFCSKSLVVSQPSGLNVWILRLGYRWFTRSTRSRVCVKWYSVSRKMSSMFGLIEKRRKAPFQDVHRLELLQLCVDELQVRPGEVHFGQTGC
ncbi:hypothetical protein KC345_g43 [Hortaea werneckii]|nr:hypothetical protein KC345_g43 [Hortaea werneckii]